MKKITNRIFAMIMAVAMMFSLSAFAFAEETELAENAEAFQMAAPSSLEDELALTDYVFESTGYSEGWFYLPTSRYVWLVINTPALCSVSVFRVGSNGSHDVYDMTYTGTISGSSTTRQVQLQIGNNAKWSSGWYYYQMYFGSSNLHAYRYMSRNTQPG